MHDTSVRFTFCKFYFGENNVAAANCGLNKRPGYVESLAPGKWMGGEVDEVENKLPCSNIHRKKSLLCTKDGQQVFESAYFLCLFVHEIVKESTFFLE